MEGEQKQGERVAAPSQCLNDHVDGGSVESQRYFLARRTALEMLRDRGYAVSEYETMLSLQEFRDIHGQYPQLDRLRISTHRRADPSNRIMVIFLGTGLVKVNTVRCIAAELLHLKESLSRLILVLQSQITKQAEKALAVFSFKVEVFQITDLLVNITKHVLAPTHHVLTGKQKQALLKKYSIQEKQIPRLSQNDAIARYHGYEKGQVVKVTYRGEITASHVTYRCVW